MTNVTVKFFGPLRDIVQKGEMTLELPGPCTGDAAFEVLAAGHPELHKWKQSVRLAVNLQYTQLSQQLNAGDEISFIPPVSGG